MGWPVVVTAGGPRQRGREYGEQAAERVRRSIDLYRDVFARYTGLGWSELVDRAGAFTGAIDAFDVELLPEIEGIAEGAGVPAEDVLTINLRTEFMYGLDRRPTRSADECTAIAAAPAATTDGHVLIAQNWDWKPQTIDTCVLLVSAPAGRPGFVTVVEAGLLAKCGVNELGIGLVTNALVSSKDHAEPGVPFHAILRSVLTSPDLDQAAAAVTAGPRASSANYLIASREGRAIDVEATPGGPKDVYLFEGGALVHANHFLWPSPRVFKDVGRIGAEDSLRRQRRVEASAPPGALSVEAVQEALRDHADHPASVCGHPEGGVEPALDGATIASLVADLTDGTIWITRGNPCTAPFERYEVSDLLDRARSRSRTPFAAGVDAG